MVKQEQIDEAVRILTKVFKSEPVLAQGVNESVYLCTMVHTAASAKDSREAVMNDLEDGQEPTEFQKQKLAMKKGTVEYMVSDGMPGERSTSFDFLDFYEALKCFNEIESNGWKLV